MPLCLHCKKEVYSDFKGTWRDKTIPGDASQYCWIDPVHGSQLHEVKIQNSGILGHFAESTTVEPVKERGRYTSLFFVEDNPFISAEGREVGINDTFDPKNH